MKFRFVINKSANLYYLLHNLAECEWPWPARKGFDMGWKREFGGLSKEEEKALKNFKKIYSKYFLKIYLGKPFFLKKNPWKDLNKQISKEEINLLKNIVKTFEKKFDILFAKNLPLLEEQQKNLMLKFKELEKKSALKSFKVLSILFNTPFSYQTIKVFLLFAKNKPVSLKKYAYGAGGEHGRGLDGKSVIIELTGKCHPQKANYITGIIWHELCHCYFALPHLHPLLSKCFPESEKPKSFLEEAINRSLFPIGVLSIRFLGAPFPRTLTPSAHDPLPEINKNQTKKILAITEKYIDQSKKIDSIYIKELINILSKEKKWAVLFKK